MLGEAAILDPFIISLSLSLSLSLFLYLNNTYKDMYMYHSIYVQLFVRVSRELVSQTCPHIM